MTIYDFKVQDINGSEKSLREYEGQVILIVNTASKCGFTAQLSELQKLYEKYSQDGFCILGFPCNQFANQELDSDLETQSFCSINYGVSFPILKKIDVKGKNASPLFKYLISETSGLFSKEIKWNFTKFLIDRNGKVFKRYAPVLSPGKIETDIHKLLNK